MKWDKLLGLIENGKYNQANYQLVVICHLSQMPELRDNKKSIAEAIANKNKALKKDVSWFMSCPVWRVLTNKGIILKISEGYKLTAKLTNSEKKKIAKLCKELLKWVFLICLRHTRTLIKRVYL